MDDQHSLLKIILLWLEDLSHENCNMIPHVSIPGSIKNMKGKKDFSKWK